MHCLTIYFNNPDGTNIVEWVFVVSRLASLLQVHYAPIAPGTNDVTLFCDICGPFWTILDYVSGAKNFCIFREAILR